MQNKIRKLAEQAGFHFYDMHDVDGQDLGETVEADSWAVVTTFAKIILEECFKTAMIESNGKLNPIDLMTAMKTRTGIE